MSGHTPGPWRVQNGYLTIYALTHGDHGTTRAIAKAVHSDHEHGPAVSFDEAEANARLISAAPDLLEAARKARSAIDALMGDTDLDGDESQEFLAMQALSAAIAKAEAP